MSGHFEFARRSDAKVTHNHSPASLTLSISDLATADGHTLSATFIVTLKLLDRRADLQLFDEQFLGSRDVVTLNDLRQFLVGPLKSSLEIFAAQHDVAACLRQHETIQTLLLQRCNAIGFGCGFEFFAPVELQLSSESLRLQQLKDQREREQAEALDRADRLNARLNAIGSADRLPVQEQTALLPAILKRAAATPVPVHIVAGDQLVTLNPATLALHSTTAPPDLGLLRSARSLQIDDTQRLIVGGQRGLWLTPTNDLPQTLYLHPSTSSRGMNAATWLRPTRELIASHGELGLIAWPIDQSGVSRTIATPSDARWLSALDERLIFAAGCDICLCDGTAVTIANAGSSCVIALLSFEHELWIIREDGMIEKLDRATLSSVGNHRVSNAVQSAAAITEAGLRAAVVAGANGEVDCITSSGDVLLRLPKSLGSIRMLTVAAGRIVGVSADRSSVIIWDGGDPRKEPRSINILARTGHRVADLYAS